MKYDYSRLPTVLKELGGVYGLYRRKGLAPISAAEWLIGNRVTLKTDDRSTFSDFDDAVRAYMSDATGEIHGILCVLQERHNLFVCDLDKPKSREDFDKRKIPNLTYEQYVEYHNADVLDMVKDFSRGTFIERSRSKQGYHIFMQGSMPAELNGHNGKFILGDIFTRNQALFLTADYPDHWPTRLAGQAGVNHLLKQIGDTLQVYDASGPLVGTVLKKSDEWGRVVHWSDEQVLEAYFKRNAVHAQLHAGTANNYPGGEDNWSTGTNLLQKELDKITGDPDQIYRIMFASPRMMNAGKAANGVDRMRRTDKFFDKYLVTARKKNNDYFAVNGGNYYHNRAAGIAHGAEMFSRMSAGAAPAAAEPEPAPSAPSAPPVATGTLDQRLIASGAEERVNEEGEIYWMHDDKFIGKQPAQLEAWLAARAPVPTQPTEQPELKIAQVKAASRFSPMAIRAISKVFGNMPSDYMKFSEPPGLLGEACRMAAKGMYEPLPYLAVPATIIAMAGIVSQTYKIHGNGLNLMMVVGAQTGVGKTQAADVWNDFIDEIISSAGPDDELLFKAKNRVAPFNFSSRVGAHTHLQRRSCFAWFNDECENLLQMLEFRDDPLAQSVKHIALKMFEVSKDSAKLEPDESRTGKHMQDRTLRNVSISSFWATTITTLQQYMNPTFLAKGYGSRLLFLVYNGVSGIEQKRVNMLKRLPEGQLRRTLKTLLKTAQETEWLYQSMPSWYSELTAEAKKEHEVPAQESHPGALIAVQEDEAANEFMEKLLPDLGALKRSIQSGQTDFPQYYTMLSRLGLIVPRMAAIMAVMENPTAPVITLPQVHWALGYCLQVMGETLSAFDNNELGITASSSDVIAVDYMKKAIRKHPEYLLDGHPYGRFVNDLGKRAPFNNLKGRDAMGGVHQTIENCKKVGYFMIDENPAMPGVRKKPGKVIRITDDPIWDDLVTG